MKNFDSWFSETAKRLATPKRTERVLTLEAQADRDDFEREYRWGGCSCHISPPCSYCTHPGNPMCQEDDSCWMEVEV